MHLVDVNNFKICELLFIEKEQLFNTVVESGLEFLDNQGLDLESKHSLIADVGFWNWWRFVWNDYNENFLRKMCPTLAGKSKRLRLKWQERYFKSFIINTQKVQAAYQFDHFREKILPSIKPKNKQHSINH
jgi:hypothetical protein